MPRIKGIALRAIHSKERRRTLRAPWRQGISFRATGTKTPLTDERRDTEPLWPGIQRTLEYPEGGSPLGEPAGNRHNAAWAMDDPEWPYLPETPENPEKDEEAPANERAP